MTARMGWRLSQPMPDDYRVMLSALARVRRVKRSEIVRQALATMIIGDAEFGPLRSQLARDREFQAAYARTIKPLADAHRAVRDNTEGAPAPGTPSEGMIT